MNQPNERTRDNDAERRLCGEILSANSNRPDSAHVNEVPDEPPVCWVHEFGAVSLPVGHPSRITSCVAFMTEDEAQEASDSCEFDSGYFPVYTASALRAALAVPSEGIASVAASEPINEAMVDRFLEFQSQCSHLRAPGVEWHGTTNGDTETAWNRRVAFAWLRAALAASDESLSRQSSEAAESRLSTRNTQGNAS